MCITKWIRAKDFYSGQKIDDQGRHVCEGDIWPAQDHIPRDTSEQIKHTSSLFRIFRTLSRLDLTDGVIIY